MAFAKSPEKIPIKALLRTNGLRINPPVAPTSFIVLIINRLEYMLKRIVFLIRAIEIKSRIAERINKMVVIFERLLLIKSITSC